jgi:Lipoprotein LpqB beta-propeller domain
MKLRTVSMLLALIAFAMLLVATTSRAGNAGSAQQSPHACPQASTQNSSPEKPPAEDTLYWTVGEHTFRRPAASSLQQNTCVPTLPEVAPNVFGQNKTFAGIDVDSVTGNRTLGLWLSDPDGTNKRLLVSHGDALAVSDPAFSSDGQAIYFTAQHPDHFELHRFDTTTSTLETLIEDPLPIGRPVSQQTTDGSRAAAVRLGSCSGKAPTDVIVRDAESQVSLHEFVPSLTNHWLTPVGWLADNELVVLSRMRNCTGPGDLLIIRSLMLNPIVEVAATNVTDALVRHPSATDTANRIVLNQNFAAPS